MKATTTILSAGIFACSAMMTLAGPAPIIPTSKSSDCHGLRASIGLTLGQTWLNEEGGNAIDGGEVDDFASALVELRLGYDLNSNWYGQLDVIGEFTDVDSDANDSFHRGWGTAFHLLYTPGEGCSSIGVFGGWFETETDERDNVDRAQRFIFGVEGLTTFQSFDILWQVGGIVGRDNAHDDGDKALRDFYFGRVVASKDLGNGWRAGGELIAGKGVMDDSQRDDFTLYGWGAHVSKQITPNWLLAIVYNGTYYKEHNDNFSDDEILEHFVGVNVTYYFGAGSNEECGPKLSLPPILRWMAATTGPLE